MSAYIKNLNHAQLDQAFGGLLDDSGPQWPKCAHIILTLP